MEKPQSSHSFLEDSCLPLEARICIEVCTASRTVLYIEIYLIGAVWAFMVGKCERLSVRTQSSRKVLF